MRDPVGGLLLCAMTMLFGCGPTAPSPVATPSTLVAASDAPASLPLASPPTATPSRIPSPTFTTTPDAPTASPTSTATQAYGNLDFEREAVGWILAGSRPQDYRFSHEPDDPHGGQFSICLRSVVDSPDGFVTLMREESARPYRGYRIHFAGYLKTESLTGWAGLWLREDIASGFRAFDNMGDRPIRGTTGWTRYEILLPIGTDARQLAFGILLEGAGRVCMDDLSFLPGT